MSVINTAKASQANSTNAFLTSLAFNAALLAVEVGAFIVLKQKLWRIYTPRAYLPPPDKRANELPSGPWKWLPAVIRTPTKDIIAKNGLDAYMFLRFIKLLTKIFAVFTALTFAVIVPVDFVGINSPLRGVEKISWTNLVDPIYQQRHAAHIVVVYILTAFTLWMIYREMKSFVDLRHDFLLSKSHSNLAQARTVLVTAVPDELSTEHDLRTFASFVPGGVDRVWMYRDSKELNELFEERQEACKRLEAAEAQLLVLATKAWAKKSRFHRKAHSKKHRDIEDVREHELVKPEPSMEVIRELVPAHKRPMHRPGLFRSKVDTIDWCKAEIASLNAKIAEKRKNHVEGKFLGSAFIRCNLQMGAHILAQCLSYHEPLRMYDKWLEANPKDIVWANLDDGALEMKSRYLISWAATIGLIIAWAFPVGFIGTMSNVSELCVKVKWLEWVCRLDDIPRGIIEGVLPPALLAGLFAILPFILQALAWYECIPRYSLMSVSVYKRFYFFLLIHGFLIVTLTSGITNAITDIIEKPTQTIQELAAKLPGASVFFLTYMVTQGLAGAGSALVQLFPLILYYVKKWLLGQTPREAYEVTFMMPSADFGVILPRLSLLATITFSYSVLSPLINLLAAISFGMFYIAWKFLMIQVFDQRDEIETGGMYFPMAIGNLFVGLYIEHVVLACLFFMRFNEEGTSAVVKASFMLALLAITAGAHIFISHCFSPLKKYLPMSLATKKMAKKFEKERRAKEGDTSEKDADDDEIDLFSRNRIKSVRRRFAKKIEKKVESLTVGPASGTPRKSESNLTIYADPGSLELQPLSRAKSSDSHVSSHSKKSEKQGKKPKVLLDQAAPKIKIENDGDSDGEEEDDGAHAFDHPSTYQEQPWIWIPKDILGLSEVLAQDLRDAGVEASDIGAFMDEKGVVEVRRNPPDEEWAGGHDA